MKAMKLCSTHGSYEDGVGCHGCMKAFLDNADATPAMRQLADLIVSTREQPEQDCKIPCPVKGSIECPFIKPCWYYGPDMRARLEKVREEFYKDQSWRNSADFRRALRMLEEILEGK